MSTAMEPASAIICCRPATPFPNRCSWSGRKMLRKAMAGWWRWSGARGRTAATSPCSTPEMSRPAPSRWCSSAIACPTVFTAIGSARPSSPLDIADVTKRRLHAHALDRRGPPRCPDLVPDLRRDHAPDDPAAAERPNRLQRRYPARLRPLDRLCVTCAVAPALGRLRRRNGRPSRCRISIFGSRLRHFDTVKILLDPGSLLTYLSLHRNDKD